MATVNFTYPKFQSLDPVTGNPRVGYKLFTYVEGTSTKKTTWTDITKLSANTNPIILDSNGEASIWLDGNYKFVLAPPTDTDPPTSPVWTVDNIRSPTDPLTQQVTLTAPVNGSFETDTNADGIPDDWNISTYIGGSVLTDVTSSSHGVTSLKFSSVGAGAGVASTSSYYEVEAGRPLSVAFSMISANANTENKVEVYWSNGAKTFISATTIYHNTTTNPTTWTRYSFNATAPSTAKYAQIVLSGVMPASTVHSTTNFDDIVLSPSVSQTVATINSDTTLTATNNATFFVSASGGIVNITLPSAATYVEYQFIRTDSTTNAVNFITVGGDTINVSTLDKNPIKIISNVNAWYATSIYATETYQGVVQLANGIDVTGVTTTGSISVGSPNLTVASGTNITNGMWVHMLGIPAGTYVVSGGGTINLVLSANATQTISSITAYFHRDDRAATPGSTQSMIAIYAARSWVDMTASRTPGTTYTNTTGREIAVSVNWASPALNSVCTMSAYVDGVVVATNGNQGLNAGQRSGIYFDVPNGSTYSVVATSLNYSSWFELK